MTHELQHMRAVYVAASRIGNSFYQRRTAQRRTIQYSSTYVHNSVLMTVPVIDGHESQRSQGSRDVWWGVIANNEQTERCYSTVYSQVRRDVRVE